MKQPEVFKKIGAIIQELHDQYEYLQTSAENLNDLELELFVANTHFLKDHAEILRKLNLLNNQAQLALPESTREQPAEEKKSAAPEPKYFEPVVQQAKPINARTSIKSEADKTEAEPIRFEIAPVEEEQTDLHSDASEDSYSFERTEPDTIRHELILDEADWDEAEDVTIVDVEAIPVVEEEVAAEPEPEKAPEPEVIEEPIKSAATEKPSLLDIYADDVKPAAAIIDEPVLTLNQKMSAQLKDKTGGDTKAEPPIADIKAAISLNDKLLFVKDLFNGYSLAYSEAIEIVNRFNSFEEADRFLKTNYVNKNNWADKKLAADKFYALLKRRYA